MPENLLKKRKAYLAIKATQAKQALLNKRKVRRVPAEPGPGAPVFYGRDHNSLKFLGNDPSGRAPQ